jgi:hypothetical protein
MCISCPAFFVVAASRLPSARLYSNTSSLRGWLRPRSISWWRSDPPFFMSPPPRGQKHALPNDFWRFTAEGLATLFGPATGFEVLDKGAVSHVSIHPEPMWRRGHLDMPTMSASDQSWVLARKVREIGCDAVRWPYDPVEGERTAKAYPIDGIDGAR